MNRELTLNSHSPLQKLSSPLFAEHNLNVYVKRDDLIHPYISGNKWRKCFFLLKHIVNSGYKTAVTFGGAYSNHIHAFSYACHQLGLKSIGIIRGEELAHKPLNSTLSFAKENGMELIFVSRDEYKKRYDETYNQELAIKHDAYLVPEGGTTLLAIDGFKEMLTEIRQEIQFDSIWVPCGSGGTIAGINTNLLTTEQVVGINVLKGTEHDLTETIQNFSAINKYIINNDYHFGGYAKHTPELLTFMDNFEQCFNIELEEVYSAKMFYAFFDMVKNGMIQNKTVVLCHTGGLQGKNHQKK
jgi:1-aminocyclopropane-1-carboxylate deaminase